MGRLSLVRKRTKRNQGEKRRKMSKKTTKKKEWNKRRKMRKTRKMRRKRATKKKRRKMREKRRKRKWRKEDVRELTEMAVTRLLSPAQPADTIIRMPHSHDLTHKPKHTYAIRQLKHGQS